MLELERRVTELAAQRADLAERKRQVSAELLQLRKRLKKAQKQVCVCTRCGFPVGKERQELYRTLEKPVQCVRCASVPCIPVLVESTNSYGISCGWGVQMI